MQTQESPLLDKFRASRPFTLAVGRRATVAGDPRPFLITGWGGPEFELSCLSTDRLEIITRPVADVTVVAGTVRYDADGVRIPEAVA